MGTKWIFILIAALSLSCPGLALAQPSEIREPSRWIGIGDIESKKFAWPGSGFEIIFRGKNLEVTLDDGGQNYLTVEQDGAAQPLKLRKGKQSYLVYSGDDDRVHNFKFLKRTESSIGTTTFISASGDGEFLPATPPARAILVIGDSFSAGYGIEGDSPVCDFSPATENNYLTYASIVARRFNADITTLAASGKGVAQNIDGSKTETIPQLMNRVIPTELQSPRVNWSTLAADVVIVHLGTNDFNSRVSRKEFIGIYSDLLKKIRARYPHAYITTAIGPIAGSVHLKEADAAIVSVVQLRVANGDRLISHVTFDRGMARNGCDFHPDRKSSEAMAKQLGDFFQEELRW